MLQPQLFVLLQNDRNLSTKARQMQIIFVLQRPKKDKHFFPSARLTFTLQCVF